MHDRAEAALAAGVLHSFDCALSRVPDGGVDFVVRRATRFPAGETAAGRGAAAPKLPANPFLAPEPALVVGEVGPAHLALLNKFCVLREHLLLVTRTFVDQRTPLDEADFAALASCMAGVDVLAFYNGGREAGASQAHKHLQLVTLPIAPHAAIPIESLLPALPFAHVLHPLGRGEIEDPPALLAKYRASLAAIGTTRPYNLVLARDWMLMVPRSRDRFEGVSINALAFAGSLFVRDAAHEEALVRAGPMAVLQALTAHPSPIRPSEGLP